MTGMQPRRAHPFAVRLGRAYARWRIGKELDGLHVDGLEHALTAMAAGPVADRNRSSQPPVDWLTT